MANEKINLLKTREALSFAAKSLCYSSEDRADIRPRYEQRLIDYRESLPTTGEIPSVRAVDQFLLRAIDAGLRALAYNPELNRETRYQYEDHLAVLFDFLAHPC